jgi:hypothetical protein
LNLFFCNAGGLGAIQKLTAVFTLYCGVLNIFSTEGALFHYHLPWLNKNYPIQLTANIMPVVGATHTGTDFFGIDPSTVRPHQPSFTERFS